MAGRVNEKHLTLWNGTQHSTLKNQEKGGQKKRSREELKWSEKEGDSWGSDDMLSERPWKWKTTTKSST